MNRRLISICILMVLIISLFTISSAAETNTDYSAAVDLLNGLDIGKIESNDSLINRGDFAKYLSNILSYRLSLYNKDGVFTDVTKNDDFSGAVYDLVARGIVSGYSTGMFMPDNPLTLDQAAKMLLSAMGYDVLASQKGGYPTGYIQIASSQKMLKDVQALPDGSLTYGAAAQLIYNSFDVPVLIQVSAGDTDDYIASDSRTLLTEYMKIEKIEGIITDNGVTALTGSTKAAKGSVSLNGKLYSEGESGASAYLGYDVAAYVDSDDDKIIYITESENCDSVYVPAQNLDIGASDFSTSNLVYTDIYGKTKKLNIDSGADFIYNNVAYVDLVTEDLKIKNGNIRLIDNDGDLQYEVVFVNDAKIFIVGAVNFSEYILYDESGTQIKLETADENITVNKDKVLSNLESIKAGDVATIYISRDKTSATIDVSSKRITGKVQSSVKNENVIELNSEYFNVNVPSLFDKISLGETYTFCIDSNGNIQGIVNAAYDNGFVAYYEKAAKAQGLDGRIEIKLFMQDGRHKIYKCVDKLNIDGDRQITNDTDIISFLETNASGKLVYCYVNDDDMITDIKLPNTEPVLPDDKKGQLHLSYQVGSSYVAYYINAQTFSGRAILSSDVLIFQIPTTSTDEEDFAIRGIDYFNNDNGYVNFDGYTFGEEDGKIDFIVQRIDPTPEYKADTRPFVVKEITAKSDKDGDVYGYIKGYGYRGEVEYSGNSETIFQNSGVKPGDVVRCPLDNMGRVNEVKKIYDRDTKSVAYDNSTEGFNSTFRTYAGNVYSKIGTIIGITTSDVNDTPSNIKANTQYYDLAKLRIYMVDATSRNIVTEASIDDIYDYESAGNDYSKVFMYNYSANPGFLVIYK